MNGLGLPFVLAAVVLAAGCAKSDQPADPVWGKQPCARCAMLVGDKRFAAQLVTGDGDRRYFDDVGCMVVWTKEHAGAAKRSWARDAQTGQWRDARTARFAKGARTPMDYGFETRADGDVSWTEVEAAVLDKEKSQP